MIRALLLIAMLYAHIIDDYYHQGILASMKQRDWWKENAPNELYRNDYIVALLEHAFSWAVAIHIPVVVYWCLIGSTIKTASFLITFASVWLIHAWVDHAKANRHTINLMTDQLLHIFQIVCAWFVYTIA